MTTEQDRNTLLYGTEHPEPPPRLLHAGRLSAELQDGNLRYVRYAGVEIIRAISFLVRSPSWATYVPDIADLSIDQGADRFLVSYMAAVRDGEARLSYRARIEGVSDGRLSFSCDTDVLSDFCTCRSGFVVLHPAAVAGLAVQVEHADGTLAAKQFPWLIDPLQPLLNLRALTHDAASGLSVICRMDGDVFEMEDQRNWTDASFKTYVRPLERPWPYVMPAGSRSTQSVSLRIAGNVAVVSDKTADVVRVEIGEAMGEMPTIGLGCTPEEALAALPDAALLAQAAVACLVCRYDPAQGHGEAELRQFGALAREIGAEMELQVVVHEMHDFATELQRDAATVRAAGVVPAAVAVSAAPDLKSTTPGQAWPPAPPLPELYRAAREAFPNVRLGGGMFSYFTELNRKRPPAELVDFVTFSTSPLVHAGDDRSVMESLEALPSVIASVRAIAAGKPFVVGPSAIGMRDNPYGAAGLPNPEGIRQAMSRRDPRQRGLFNAAWTLGYIARFAAGGATRVAVSAPVGDFGILEDGHPLPVFPVLRGCAALRGRSVRAATTSREHDVLALCAEDGKQRVLWLANLTQLVQEVEPPPMFGDATVDLMDATNCRRVLAQPDGFERGAVARDDAVLRLQPYAVVRLCVSV